MKHKYIVAFIIGLCIMMFVHLASGRSDLSSFGGELIFPALTVAIVCIADESQKWYDNKKKGGRKDV